MNGHPAPRPPAFQDELAPASGLRTKSPPSGVGLIEDVLYRYLYKEDVQEIARSYGLSSSGTKEEIIDEILWSERFDPSDALQYLSVSELRQLCREYRLPATGDRDALLEHAYEAIEQDRPPIVRRSVRRNRDSDGGERRHPESTGPWAVASIVAALIGGAIVYAIASIYGVILGAVVSIVIGLGFAVGLVLTSHHWIPWIARHIRPVRSE